MFSDAVLDHFRNPRHAGDLPDATARVEATNPVCGDVLQLAVRVEKGKIAEARFLCRGCTTAIACGSFLADQLQGRDAVDLTSIDSGFISEGLGGLPPATFHGADLAADAARALHRALK